MAKKQKEERWLKATFEQVTAKRVVEATKQFNPEGGCVDFQVVVYWTDAEPEAVRDAIWALNGGCLCEVVEITDRDADTYL